MEMEWSNATTVVATILFIAIHAMQVALLTASLVDRQSPAMTATGKAATSAICALGMEKVNAKNAKGAARWELSKVYIVTLTSEHLKTLRLLCRRALNPKYSDLNDSDQKKVVNAELALYKAEG